MKYLLLFVTVALGLFNPNVIRAQEVTLIAPGGMRCPLDKMQADFEKAIGHPVKVTVGVQNGIGESPYTWEHVLKAAPKLKAIGHPIGIGQSQELDSNMALIAFLMCFGGFIQDEHNMPTLYTKKTVEAVQFMANMYKNGEDSAIFGWNLWWCVSIIGIPAIIYTMIGGVQAVTWVDVNVGDFTGDGWPDVLLASTSGSRLYVNPKGESRRWDMFANVIPPEVGIDVSDWNRRAAPV